MRRIGSLGHVAIVGVVGLATTGACGFRPSATGDAGGDDGSGSDAKPIDAPPDAYVPPTSPRTITIHADLANNALSNIPILVRLDPAKIDYAGVADPATDLRFDAPTLTQLFYDVESWNPGGVSAVWVLVPAIPVAADTTLTFSWGHGIGTANPTMVWNNYETVLHGDAPLVDPSGAFYAPTGIGVTAPDGKAGKAIGFDGSGDHRVTFANGDVLFDAWSAFSLQFWIYPDYASQAAFGSGDKAVMNEGGSLDLGRLYKATNGVDLTIQVDFHFTSSNDAYLHADIPLRTWTHVAYEFTGTALRMFVNGNQSGTFPMQNSSSEDLRGSSASYYLGHATTSFTGALDELEIEQRVHNAEWVHTQFLAMADQLLIWN